MENTNIFVLIMSLVAFLAGTALYVSKSSPTSNLRAGICVLLGVYIFSLSQAAVSSPNGYPDFWMRLLGFWPLLPALLLHHMLSKYGSPKPFSMAVCKKVIYWPAAAFMVSGILNPKIAYQYFSPLSKEGLLIPNLAHFAVQLQVVWLVLLSVILVHYMVSKEVKQTSSYLFRDIMIWCLPLSFILIARFSMPISFGHLSELFWVPAIIPVVNALYQAYSNRYQTTKLKHEIHLPPEIIIQTDESGKILQTNGDTRFYLGGMEPQINHISAIFPDLQIDKKEQTVRLTYMKKDKKSVPVHVAVKTIPGEQGFLITGSAVN